MSATGQSSSSGSGSGKQYSEIQFQEYDPNEGEHRRRRQPPDPSRAYKCEHSDCERSFDRPSTLAQHILTHTGERPHVCQFCQMHFTVASNLYRHMRGCPSKPPGLNVEDENYIPSRNGSKRSRTGPKEIITTLAQGGATLNFDVQLSPTEQATPAPIPTNASPHQHQPRARSRRALATQNVSSSTDSAPSAEAPAPLSPRAIRATRRSEALNVNRVLPSSADANRRQLSGVITGAPAGSRGQAVGSETESEGCEEFESEDHDSLYGGTYEPERDEASDDEGVAIDN